MIIDNNYVILPENAEEVKTANDAILKLRREKQREELIDKHRTNFALVAGDSISELGLNETKKIVRELQTMLRKVSNGVDE